MDDVTNRTSSGSSVVEFANKMFQESPLELQVSARGADNSSEQQAHVPRGTRKMYLAAFVVLQFAVCMGMTATYSATATMDMKKDKSPKGFRPSEDQVTWVGSLMTVGALVGSTSASFLTAALGRKGTLMLNALPFTVGWVVIANAPSLGVVYGGRLLTGFSTGVVSVATPMYLVEIASAEVRGLLGASFQLFVVVGVLIVSALGAVLSWKLLAVAGAGATTLSACMMLFMPESPKWLLSKQKRTDAKKALLFLQGFSTHIEEELQIIENEIRNQPKGNIQWREFLSPALYKPFVLSIVLMLFQQFSGVNAVFFYTVDIFHSAGSTLDPVLATILVAFVQVLATVVSTLLMDKAGRKPLLMVSGGCMALSLVIFGCFDLEKTKDERIVEHFGWVPLVCLMAFVTAFSIGFGPTPWLMVAEMTPARYRSFVSGIATGLNWTFAFVITKSFKSMRSTLQAYGVYWFYACFCTVSIFMTYFFLPETKGKTSEDIQSFFNRQKDSPMTK